MLSDGLILSMIAYAACRAPQLLVSLAYSGRAQICDQAVRMAADVVKCALVRSFRSLRARIFGATLRTVSFEISDDLYIINRGELIRPDPHKKYVIQYNTLKVIGTDLVGPNDPLLMREVHEPVEYGWVNI